MRLTTLFSLIVLSAAMALAGPRLVPSSNIEGDVNIDGDVNIADVNAVIDVVLSGRFDPHCDVNGDGDVNITDINRLIDLIFRGPVTPIVDAGMYMGLIGYNQSLVTKEISVLDTLSVTDYYDYVTSLTCQPGRLLYYSVDQALNKLNKAQHPEIQSRKNDL